MNRFSIIGEIIDVSELRYAGPKKAPVITARYKTGDSILKVTYWGKKAENLESRYSTTGMCVSVVGWLDINTWEYNDTTYAELKGTADKSYPIEINIELMSQVEIIGSIARNYGGGNYLVKSTSETKAKKFICQYVPCQYVPFPCDQNFESGQIVHVMGSLRADKCQSNIARQTVEAARVIKF